MQRFMPPPCMRRCTLSIGKVWTGSRSSFRRTARPGKAYATVCAAPRADELLPDIYNRFTLVTSCLRIYRQEEAEMKKMLSKVMLGAVLLAGAGIAGAVTKEMGPLTDAQI